MKIEVELSNEAFEFLNQNLRCAPFIQKGPIEVPVQYDGGECTAPQVVASKGGEEFYRTEVLAAFYLDEYITMLQELLEDDVVGSWDCFGKFSLDNE